VIIPDWPVPARVRALVLTRGDGEPALPGPPAWLRQVHGTRVVDAALASGRPEADAAVARAPGVVCAVQAADCMAVLLADEDGTVVGAAHAGWRGLAAGVIENTITRLAVDPSGLLAWLGPAISQPSFEVGDEVRAAFVAVAPEAAGCFARNSRDRWQADLYGLARQRLASAGVRNIYGGGFCTYLDERRFHSYRRDPACGRMLSFVGSKSP